jgi:hypothetical protein
MRKPNYWIKNNIEDGIKAGILNKEINNTCFASKGIEIYSIGKESVIGMNT